MEARPKEIRKYETPDGKCPFADWIDTYEDNADYDKILVYIDRVEQGNFSNVTSVGEGVFEIKIDHGPGYRVYFGQHGDLVILLGGGIKKTQQSDIETAKGHWRIFNAEENK